MKIAEVKINICGGRLILTSTQKEKRKMKRRYEKNI